MLSPLLALVSILGARPLTLAEGSREEALPGMEGWAVPGASAHSARWPWVGKDFGAWPSTECREGRGGHGVVLPCLSFLICKAGRWCCPHAIVLRHHDLAHTQHLALLSTQQEEPVPVRK